MRSRVVMLEIPVAWFVAGLVLATGTGEALAAPQSGGAREFVTYNQNSTTGSPAGVAGAATSALPGGGSLLFGGANSAGALGLTHVLNGTNWSQQFPSNSPSPRVDAYLTLDGVRQNNLLFGGKNSLGVAQGDTWVWSAGQWSPVTTGIAPTPRSSHRMAFDPVSNRILLFGGEDTAGVALGDFWAWNGTAWTQLTPSILPPARAHFGMDWDAIRGRLVLYGGSSGGTKRDDLWEWDGSGWTQIVVPPNQGVVYSPGARDRFAFCYDPLRERVMLHGGQASNGVLGDLWSWTGTEWTAHIATTSAAPSARSGHSLWYDPRANELLLFGGMAGGSYNSDLWSVKLLVTSRWNTYGQGCPGALGIPSFAVRAGSTPTIGQTLICDLTNVPTTLFNSAFGVYDIQRSYFLGQPIPVSLAFAGLPGCDAWTGGYWSTFLPPMQAGVGTSLSLSLPTANAIRGAELFLQALVLDNSNGRWASVSNGVEVRVGDPWQPPAANFAASPFVGTVPMLVQFTDLSGNVPTAWGWDFQNDGIVDSTSQNPTFTYSSPGVYSVRLTVSNPGGSSTVVGAVWANPVNMIPISSGTFQMGSTAPSGSPYYGQSVEQPVHPVTITRIFWIGRYEVTQSEYQALMGSNPSAFQGPTLPVEQVSWYQAMAYCVALTAAESAVGRVPAGYQYRLPTEAEWEYCCRAGTTTEYSVGNELFCAQARFQYSFHSSSSCNSPGTVPVGTYPANPWGLHDMPGNVWEWCLDSWDGLANYPAAAVTDPWVSSGPFRVIRGGCWDNNSNDCRSAIRYLYNPTYGLNYIGFRVVLAPVLVP